MATVEKTISVKLPEGLKDAIDRASKAAKELELALEDLKKY